jgi:hypothetical protein
MSEIEPQPTEDQIEKIAANVDSMIEFLKEVPEDLKITRDIVATYAVHIDENGQMDPPQGLMNLTLMKAILSLELRMLALEGRDVSAVVQRYLER